MSKIVFRASVTTLRLGAKQSVTWRCSHEHKELRTAAQCAQRRVRSGLPNISAPASQTLYEEVTASYEVKSEATGVEWVNAQYYRTYVVR